MLTANDVNSDHDDKSSPCHHQELLKTSTYRANLRLSGAVVAQWLA